jgi:nucleoside-diphosphate-sugar epimerase
MGNQKQTILMTGGSGFLGSHLLRYLAHDPACQIVVLKRQNSNLRRIEGITGVSVFYDIETIDLDDMFKKHSINTILHCATNYGRNSSSSMEIVEANLLLPLRLIETGNKYGVSCFISTDTILDKRISDYSLSKSQFKQWLHKFSQDMTCINIELEHFYGPSDDDSKFVTYIIKSLIDEMPYIDLTRGDQLRYFIYIDDVIEAFKTIMRMGQSLGKGFFNYQVATEEAITIREFVEKVKILTGNVVTRLNFGAIPYRENEVMSFTLDLSELKNNGWKPLVSLQEGLKRTIESERSRR